MLLEKMLRSIASFFSPNRCFTLRAKSFKHITSIRPYLFVIPAKAGIQFPVIKQIWMPAFAGMTNWENLPAMKQQSTNLKFAG